MSKILETFSNNYDPENILSTLDLNSLPVNLDAITSKLGVEVSYDFDFDKIGHSGEISWSDDRSTAVIWVNPTDSKRRQRFTLAHELGHLFHHMLPAKADTKSDESFIDSSKQFRRSGVISEKEKEANNFSANLLMPKHMIKKEIRVIADKYKTDSGKLSCSRETFISELSEIFDVSTQAMEYRLKNLGLLK